MDQSDVVQDRQEIELTQEKMECDGKTMKERLHQKETVEDRLEDNEREMMQKNGESDGETIQERFYQ